MTWQKLSSIINYSPHFGETLFLVEKGMTVFLLTFLTANMSLISLTVKFWV